MRDGVKLTTDLYLPDEKGKFPTLLLRTPYTRKMDGPNPGRLFTAHGYAVVVQDLRGTYQSEGERTFLLDLQEAWDGQDTIAWILQQPWSNGKVGTFGSSAKGAVQYALAPYAPPALKCMYVSIAPAKGEAIFHGGVLHLGWLLSVRMIQKLTQTVSPRGGHEGGLFALAKLVYRNEKSAFLGYNVEDLAPSVRIPIAHIGGWFDMFTEGTISAFKAFQEKGGEGARGRQKLVVGPWTHTGLGKRKAGELLFPENATLPLTPLDWFDRCLKGKGSIEAIPPIQYYVMGDVRKSGCGNRFRKAKDFPPPSKPIRLYLHPSGLLSWQKPKGEGKLSYFSDPRKPIPYLCGAELFLKSGPCDQRPLEKRSDLLLFSSKALEEPLEITGSIEAWLYFSSTALDTDFALKLADVYPDGRAMLIVDGIQRARFREGMGNELLLEPGKRYKMKVHLGTTSYCLNRGHRLRLYVGSANFPRFLINPQTGGSLALTPEAAKAMQKGEGILPLDLYGKMQGAENSLFLGGSTSSYLVLPLVSEESGAFPEEERE